MLYYHKFSRNLPLLSRAAQEKIRASRFCIVGLGGTGGFALECLLRLGAQQFLLFDHDRFELTNFNRQLLATDHSLDGEKTAAARERALSINQGAKIWAGREFSADKLAGVDVCLDCSDNLRTKSAVAQECRKKRIPYVFCSAQGSKGSVSVFNGYPFDKAFQVGGAKLAELPGRSCGSIICPAASLAGTLAASQALNILARKPVVKAPDALFFDLFDKRVFWRARLG